MAIWPHRFASKEMQQLFLKLRFLPLFLGSPYWVLPIWLIAMWFLLSCIYKCLQVALCFHSCEIYKYSQILPQKSNPTLRTQSISLYIQSCLLMRYGLLWVWWIYKSLINEVVGAGLRDKVHGVRLGAARGRKGEPHLSQSRMREQSAHLLALCSTPT
jgi:hypothetical protein